MKNLMVGKKYLHLFPKIKAKSKLLF